MSNFASPGKELTYKVTFKDGTTMTVRAPDGATARKVAARRKYHPGTLPDQLEAQRKIAHIADVPGSER